MKASNPNDAKYDCNREHYEPYFFFNFELKNPIFPLAPNFYYNHPQRNWKTSPDSRSSSRTSSIGNHGKIQSAKLQLEIKVEIVAQ